jgi:hypothetical protein
MKPRKSCSEFTWEFVDILDPLLVWEEPDLNSHHPDRWDQTAHEQTFPQIRNKQTVETLPSRTLDSQVTVQTHPDGQTMLHRVPKMPAAVLPIFTTHHISHSTQPPKLFKASKIAQEKWPSSAEYNDIKNISKSLSKKVDRRSQRMPRKKKRTTTHPLKPLRSTQAS